MGKPKSKKTKNSTSTVDINRTSGEQDGHTDVSTKYSFEKILEKAVTFAESFDFELASKFYHRCYDLQPKNVKLIEGYASVLMELGKVGKCKELLQAALELEPESGYQKFLSLAQLTNGLEAVALYNRGIEIMNASRNQPKSVDNSSSLSSEISSAYCALSELYMTDLCDLEEAEEHCKSYAQMAINSDPSNPEAYQVMANYHMIRLNFEECKSLMEKSLALWLPDYRKFREGQIGDPSKDFQTLGYEARISAVKILIELEMFDDSVEICNGLIDENDTVVETWYLLGWINHIRGEEFLCNAKYYLQKAQKVHQKYPTDDTALAAHIEELLFELQNVSNDDSDLESDKENEVSDFEPNSTDSEHCDESSLCSRVQKVTVEQE